MSCNKFHLTDTDHPGKCYAIQQGCTYQLEIYYPEDLTTCEFTSQIRKNYADLESGVLASFSFGTAVYGSFTVDGETGMQTRVVGTLSASQTQLIPIPDRRRADVDAKAKPGINVWVYDAKAKFPSGLVILVGKGWVEVDPETTRIQPAPPTPSNNLLDFSSSENSQYAGLFAFGVIGGP